MRALKKYLLTLFILLLNGYSCLDARTGQDFVFHASVNFPQNTELVNAGNALDHQAFATDFALFDQKENFKICSEKNEEESDKLIFLKTFTAVSNYFTTLNSQSFKGLFIEKNNRVPVFEHWFYSSSHRFGILQMMRI